MPVVPKSLRRIVFATAVLLALMGALGANAVDTTPAPAANSTVGVTATDTGTDAVSATSAEAPANESEAEVPALRKLPFSNKTLVVITVAFMLTVCGLFSAGAGYAMYKTAKRKK